MAMVMPSGKFLHLVPDSWDWSFRDQWSATELFGRFSPRGGHLLLWRFGRDASRANTYATNFYDVDLHTYNITRQVTSGDGVVGTRPAYSANGRWFAFVHHGDGWRRAAIQRLDGSQPMRRIEVGSATDDVDWVPGSPQLVVLQTTDMDAPENGPHADVFLLNLDGTRTNLTRTPEYDDTYPDVSPDGTRVIFAAWPPPFATAPPEIRIVNIDGTNQHTLALGASPVWSPDGCRIAFVDPDKGLVTMAPDGSDLRLVGPTVDTLRSGKWAPSDWQAETDSKPMELRLSGVRYVDGHLSLRVRTLPLHAFVGLTLTLQARSASGDWRVIEQRDALTKGGGGHRFLLVQPRQRYCRVSVRFVGDQDHRPTKKAWPIACHT